MRKLFLSLMFITLTVSVGCQPSINIPGTDSLEFLDSEDLVGYQGGRNNDHSYLYIDMEGNPMIVPLDTLSTSYWDWGVGSWVSPDLGSRDIFGAVRQYKRWCESQLDTTLYIRKVESNRLMTSESFENDAQNFIDMNSKEFTTYFRSHFKLLAKDQFIEIYYCTTQKEYPTAMGFLEWLLEQ